MRPLLLAFALACIACTPNALTPNAQTERAFIIPDPALVPEGIAYDPRTRAFFVSSTWQRRIVRIAADGAQTEFTPRNSDALYGVLGMAVDAQRRRLWAAHSSGGAGMPIQRDSSEGRAGLALFDLDTGRRLRNIAPADDALHFLNDVAIARDGSVYVTDSATGVVYRADANAMALTPFITLPDGARPNGLALAPNGRTLIVAGWSQAGGRAYRVDLSTQAVTPLSMPEGMQVTADGLYLHDGDLIAVQPWSDACRICRFDVDDAGAAILSQRALAAAHPDFLQPTTGVIVGDAIYVIANAQLQHFRRLWTEHQGEPPREMLRDIVILRIPLD